MQALVDSDVFKADKKTIDTQKVLNKIWENRTNMSVVEDLANLLSQFVDEPRVFKDIEFYMPQLAHLIIHLDQNSKAPSLERLAMVLCQNSVHTALQLSFLFSAALEDYQPEKITGQANPECNPYYFKRCARLLQDVERAVIYGSQSLSTKEERALKRRISTTETAPKDARQLESELIDAKKLEVANMLSRTTQLENYDGLLNGSLMYKRTERKSMLAMKPWKQRFFMVDQRVLYCFREPHSVNPLRTVPLAACHVDVIDNDPKYGDRRFDIVNYSNGTKFQLMAENKEQRTKWVNFLRKEILGAPIVVLEGAESPTSERLDDREGISHSSHRKSFVPLVTEDDMSAIQRKRFNYFKQMRIFLTNVTNICERLRFKERPVRKYFLRRDMKDLQIPPFAYLPLAGSLDVFQQILRTLPTEGHAFSTKARCPALMLFEMEVHPRNVDIASFLCCELERYEENQVINRTIEIKNGSSSTWEEVDDSVSDHEKVVEQGRLNSILGSQLGAGSTWKAEGTGLARLESMGLKVAQPPRSAEGKPESKSDGKENATSPASATGGGTAPEQNRLHSGSGHNTPAAPASPLPTTADTVEISQGQNLGPTLLGEAFHEKAARLRAKSPYGHLPGWRLGGMIAKSNDDVRQEVFVMQLIRYYQNAFREANLPCWLFTYTILSTSQSTGLIELIPNASSLDGLKKKEGYPGSLRKYFEMTYGYVQGQPEPPAFRTALNNYINSMSAYSIVAYLLAIKDRHNGNVMLDNVGHIIHIDFGFVFGLAPGKAFSMEKAPWKLTEEMVEVMGGRKSADFAEYQRQCTQALLVARKHAKQVKALMEMMAYHSSYPAFRYNAHAMTDFMGRLYLELPDHKVETQVQSLMNWSYNHTGTGLYDQFQLATNGIAV